MRLSAIAFATAAALSAGCAYTPEYYDNHAQVDANPMCMARSDRPSPPGHAGDAPVLKECMRETGVRYERKREPVDLRRKKEEDDD